MTILPRMWSGSHASTYRDIMGLKAGEKPSFIDNIAYMFKRQMGHMYWRYFMWNFSGRESDIQDASWLSPLAAFKDVPDSIAYIQQKFDTIAKEWNKGEERLILKV